MKRKAMMMMMVLAVGLIGSQLTGWAAEDPKIKMDADIKAISTQLTSDDPLIVQGAIKAIQQLIAKDPRTGLQTLTTRWNMPLFFAKRYDDIANLTLTGIIFSESPRSRPTKTGFHCSHPRMDNTHSPPSPSPQTANRLR